MSMIYSLTKYLGNNIYLLMRKSLFFTIIFEIFHFIETKWTNSYFKKLYPNEEFLSIIKNNSRILREDIFSPIIVLITFSLFLILSINNVSQDLQITIIIGFIFFLIGSLILPKFFLNNQTEGKKPNLNISEIKQNKNYQIPQFESKDIYAIGFCLMIVGIIFFFISIASVGGIPLLKPSIRYLLKPALTMPVFLIIPAIGLIASDYLNRYQNKEINRSQVRFRFLILTGIGTITVLFLGYRTPIIVILLLMIIIGYYGKILSVWEVIIGGLLGVSAIIGIGYMRSLGELAITSNTNPFSTLQNRADFTLNVLNLLNQISGNFGLLHGKLIASSMPGSNLGPRMLIGKLIAWRSEVTVTPTLFGQMLVDFGKVGVTFEMCLLGFILGIGYKIIKINNNPVYITLYSLLLSYSIVGVETGILDIQVLFYFFIGIFIYLAAIFKDKGIKLY